MHYQKIGKVLILEFSAVQPELLKKVYDSYSFGILPVLGKLIADVLVSACSYAAVKDD